MILFYMLALSLLIIIITQLIVSKAHEIWDLLVKPVSNLTQQVQSFLTSRNFQLYGLI